MRIHKASQYFPLIGREAEILAKHEAGTSQYKLAVEYGVYPNAIRDAVRRARIRREAQELIGK